MVPCVSKGFGIQDSGTLPYPTNVGKTRGHGGHSSSV